MKSVFVAGFVFEAALADEVDIKRASMAASVANNFAEQGNLTQIILKIS